jgi:hypothetical protein
MLFGHLAARFSTSPENLATEALAFIVNRSAAMREALRRLVGRTGIELPSLARFFSQAGDQQGNIPDLVGMDATGAERLFVENKFWAGLTENQPAGSLERLPAEGGGVLVFVVPSKRLPIVWTELASSAMNRATRLPNPEQLAGELQFARLTSSTAIAATTWNAVLDSLEAAARASGEASAAADIVQLRSLCDVMDNEAFLPVRMEELTNLEVPRRLIGFANLISDLTARAVSEGIADRKGLAHALGWYSAGRYLRIGPAPSERPERLHGPAPGAWLGIDHEKRSRYGITPLWIVFLNTEYGRAAFVLEALKAWAPPRLFKEDGCAYVPLTVLPDERILEALLEQLRHLHAALGAARPLVSALDHALLMARAAAFPGKDPDRPRASTN